MKTSQDPHVSQVPGQSHKLSAHHVLRTAAHLLPAHFVHGGPRDVAETRSCANLRMSKSPTVQSMWVQWKVVPGFAVLGFPTDPGQSVGPSAFAVAVDSASGISPRFFAFDFFCGLCLQKPRVFHYLAGVCLGVSFGSFGWVKARSLEKQPKWGGSKKWCLHIHLHIYIFTTSRPNPCNFEGGFPVGTTLIAFWWIFHVSLPPRDIPWPWELLPRPA